MRLTLLWALLVSITAAAWAGDVEGTVTIKSSVRAFKHGQKKQDPGYEGTKAPAPSSNETENVVLTLEGEGLSKCTPLSGHSADSLITQKDRQFRPHVLVVPKGSTVCFRNEDNFIHRVYSVSEPAKFDFRGFTGDREQAFPTAGEVEIFCGIHTTMNAYIIVTANDYYTKADGQGHFKIRNVPPGSYTLRVWHPRLESKQQKITVPKTGSVKLDLTL